MVGISDQVSICFIYLVVRVLKILLMFFQWEFILDKFQSFWIQFTENESNSCFVKFINLGIGVNVNVNYFKKFDYLVFFGNVRLFLRLINDGEQLKIRYSEEGKKILQFGNLVRRQFLNILEVDFFLRYMDTNGRKGQERMERRNWFGIFELIFEIIFENFLFYIIMYSCLFLYKYYGYFFFILFLLLNYV